MVSFTDRICLTAVCAMWSLLAAPKAVDAQLEFASRINHQPWDMLLKKYVNDQGLVAYEKWKSEPSDVRVLDEYLNEFASAANQPARSDELAASAINCYNATAIRWILQNYPTESIWELKSSFTRKAVSVGGHEVSLDDIENRTVRPSLGYRAHAVLVCCARSCPPLQRSAYSADQLDHQIDSAFRTWLGRDDLNRFEPANKKVEISNIFKWFAADFSQAGGVKKVLLQFGPSADHEFLETGNYDISYLTYNWGLNDQGEHGRSYSGTNQIFDFLKNKFN